jgi:REP element-mobilizing transposase RayT
MVGFFTWHAYKSWLPDRPEGYVRRGDGVLPTDPERADQYGRNSNQDGLIFDERVQQAMIHAILAAAEHQRLRIHSVGTDNTHLHVLASWHDDRAIDKVAARLRYSITRHLNQTFFTRSWLGEGGHTEHVENRGHFEHLINVYIPKHAGLKWREGIGHY